MRAIDILWGLQHVTVAMNPVLPGATIALLLVSIAYGADMPGAGPPEPASGEEPSRLLPEPPPPPEPPGAPPVPLLYIVPVTLVVAAWAGIRARRTGRNVVHGGVIGGVLTLATIKLLARLGREYRLAPDPQDYWKFCATVVVAGAVLAVLALWLMPILAAARRRFLARPVHSVFFLRISPQLPWRGFAGPPILLACGLTFCLIGALVLWLWPRDPGTMSVWVGPRGEVCSGLLNLGLSLLLLGAVAQALGSQVFARLWHAPRDLPRVQRALAAGALSPVSLLGGGLLIGAALGLAGGGSLRSVFGWLGMLYPTPWVFILPHGFQLPGVAIIPLFLAWWFTLGFLVGAVFRRRWFMLGVWLLLVGCHLGLTLWMLVGALSH